MQVFRLKVTIPGLKGLYRLIEARGNCTFDDLHEMLMQAHRNLVLQCPGKGIPS